MVHKDNGDYDFATMKFEMVHKDNGGYNFTTM